MPATSQKSLAAALRLGNRLYQLRIERGLTGYRLAREAELHPQHQNLHERGLACPSVAQCVAYARALGVKPSEFLSCLDEVV